MTFTQRLSLLWRRFSPLEERLFATVRSALPLQATPMFDAQVAAITHVQRLPQWTEIDYYRRRFRRVDWSGVPTFPRTGEFQLSRVHFAVGGRRYRATLACVAGHIFDFGITPSPQSVAFADWDSVPTAALLADPLVARDLASVDEIPQAWSDALRRLEPQAASVGWLLHEATTANRITLHEGEFLVLAQRDGEEFILHRTEPPADVMFHLASPDATPTAVEGELGEIFLHPRRNT